MISRFWNFVGDAYAKNGYVAVLVIAVVVVVLVLAVSYATGYDVASIMEWLGAQ